MLTVLFHTPPSLFLFDASRDRADPGRHWLGHRVRVAPSQGTDINVLCGHGRTLTSGPDTPSEWLLAGCGWWPHCAFIPAIWCPQCLAVANTEVQAREVDATCIAHPETPLQERVHARPKK